MYLSRHRDIEKLSPTTTANIRSFTLPLAQDLPRIGHIDGFFFFLQRDWICPEEAFVPSAIKPSLLQGPLGGPASGAVVLMEKSPRLRRVPCAILMPLGSQRCRCTRELSPPLFRVTPQYTPLPRRRAGGCREREQLAKAASSARLTAKELQQIMEIGSLTC